MDETGWIHDYGWRLTYLYAPAAVVSLIAFAAIVLLLILPWSDRRIGLKIGIAAAFTPGWLVAVVLLDTLQAFFALVGDVGGLPLKVLIGLVLSTAVVLLVRSWRGRSPHGARARARAYARQQRQAVDAPPAPPETWVQGQERQSRERTRAW